jgi:hypothetical protein
MPRQQTKACVQGKEFRVDALWPLVHFQKGGPAPGNLSHKVFPLYSYTAGVQHNDSRTGTASYRTKGHFLLYYWDSTYSLPSPAEAVCSSLSSSSSSSSSSSASLTAGEWGLGSASGELDGLPPSPSFSHSWGLFPVAQRTLGDGRASFYLFPFLSTSATFHFVEELVTEMEEADTSDDEGSESETDSSDEDTPDEDDDEEEEEEASSDDEEKAKRRKGKGKEKITAEKTQKGKSTKKKAKKRKTRAVFVQHRRMVKKERRSVFVPVLMTYYTKDDADQSSSFHSPIIWKATRGTQGDGWLLLPLYYSSREGGGLAAGGSETRVVAPFYYRAQDNNRRTLAVLPFYVDKRDLITNSHLKMRSPAWYVFGGRYEARGSTARVRCLLLTGGWRG